MPQPLSPQALSDLIGSIYDCALDPDLWDATLADIMAAFEARTAMLGLMDRREHRFLINRAVGLEPHHIDGVARHLPEVDGRVEAFLSRNLLDEPFVMSRHVARAEFDASPYVREMMKPYGMVDIIQYHLVHTPRHISALGMARHETYGIITPREIELGRLLLPHLRRAVTISRVLDATTVEGGRIAGALDALRCGVVLTDARGAIIYANRAGAEMLQASGPLRDERGVLKARAPAASRELRDAIRLAAEDEARIGRQGLAIRLSEPQSAPVFAHVLPLTGSDFRTRLQPNACAAVFIGAEPDESSWSATIAQAFGLTRAETRVLARLLAGRTLAETAADLRVAASTARTHLDSIFAKTGASRQAELMRLALQVQPPAG